MKFLTGRERGVLASVLLLLAVGWAVQTWRQARSLAAAPKAEEPPLKAQKK